MARHRACAGHTPRAARKRHPRAHPPSARQLPGRGWPWPRCSGGPLPPQPPASRRLACLTAGWMAATIALTGLSRWARSLRDACGRAGGRVGEAPRGREGAGGAGGTRVWGRRRRQPCRGRRAGTSAGEARARQCRPHASRRGRCRAPEGRGAHQRLGRLPPAQRLEQALHVAQHAAPPAAAAARLLTRLLARLLAWRQVQAAAPPQRAQGIAVVLAGCGGLLGLLGTAERGSKRATWVRRGGGRSPAACSKQHRRGPTGRRAAEPIARPSAVLCPPGAAAPGPQTRPPQP